MLVPNSREQKGKLWLPKKQKTAQKTTLQKHFLQVQAINLFKISTKPLAP